MTSFISVEVQIVIGGRSLKVIPFSHAIVDDEGEIVRKYRWSIKEAKWHKDKGENVIVLPKEPKAVFNFDDYEECLF